MIKKPYLSVIIPCYNEEDNLKRGVLTEVENYLKKQKFESEVIISDDGSKDKSPEIIEKFAQRHSRFKLLKNPHAGKPFALRSGLMKAKGEYSLLTDMDQSTPIREFGKLFPWLKKDFDVVIGSRGIRRRNFPFYRQLASNVFRFARRVLLLKDIIDTQCGFKSFKTQVGKSLFDQMAIFNQKAKVKGWRVTAYDVEFLFLAEKRGYRIKEVFVEWEDKDIARGKKRNFLKESWEMLKEILRVKFNNWRGYYG